MAYFLSSMGASVTKVESPRRIDSTRQLMPSLFHALNAGKTPWKVDYESDAGREEVYERVKKADVLIEQFRPGVMSSFKLGYENLKKINPNLVYVSITGYGQSGPLASAAGHDINYLATSGLLSQLSPSSGSRPTLPGFQLADVAAGSYTALLSLQGALLRRALQPGAGGCFVDVNMTAGALPIASVPLSIASMGLDPELFCLINGRSAVNYGVYDTKDGKHIAVGALEAKFWKELCKTIGRPEWGKYNQLQLMYKFFPVDELRNIFLSKTRDEWTAIFANTDCCVSPVLSLNEALKDKYHADNNSFGEVEVEVDRRNLQELGTAISQGSLSKMKVTTVNLPFKVTK